MRNFTALIDTGVGGISVLREARRQLPDENFLYYADVLNAPYGDKPTTQITKIMRENAQMLIDRGAHAILIACNTATSAAAAVLRESCAIPILGMEPALKPAVEQTKGQILVLGTALTIREKKFRALMETIGAGREIVPIPCPGLMQIVEEDPLGDKAVAYLSDIVEPYWQSARAIVLGCTHYVFLRPIFEWLLPNARVFDGNEGVCRHLRHTLAAAGVATEGGSLELDCSLPEGEARAAYLAKCAALLK